MLLAGSTRQVRVGITAHAHTHTMYMMQGADKLTQVESLYAQWWVHRVTCVTYCVVGKKHTPRLAERFCSSGIATLVVPNESDDTASTGTNSHPCQVLRLIEIFTLSSRAADMCERVGTAGMLAHNTHSCRRQGKTYTAHMRKGAHRAHRLRHLGFIDTH